MQALPFLLFLLVLPFPGTVALRLACLAAAVLVAAFSWRQLSPPPIPCKWAIALWAGVAVASLAYAIDPTYSLGEIKNEVGYTLMAFVAFLAWTRDEKRLRLACLTVLAGFVALSVYALGGYAWRGEWPSGPYFGEVGTVSNYLVTVGPVLALTVALYWRELSGKWLALSGILFVVVALLSAQRAIWPAIGLQAILLCIWLWRSRIVSPRRLGLAVLLLAISLSAAFYVSDRSRTGDDPSSPFALDNDLRPQLWRELGTRIAEHPLTGAGFGRRALSKAHSDLIPTESLWHAHNVVLNYGAGAGVPGMISILILFAALAMRFWRLALAAAPVARACGLAGAAMIVGVFARNMANDFFVRDGALMFWAVAGILLGYALRAGPVAAAGRPEPPG